MNNQDKSIGNAYEDDEREEELLSMTKEIEGDTYSISDNESTTDSPFIIDSNIMKDEEKVESNGTSIDLLLNKMVLHMFSISLYLCILKLIYANVETLHFESGCLKDSNRIQLNLRCSSYEHIEILRVIYGYSKQRTMNQCHFSIYDCIQEGASRNILACNGRQACIINLTKAEIHSTTVTTKGVPACSDFNYVQINFACVPDAKDICDSWKEEGAVVHVSHTRSNDKQYRECKCKVRSSLSNGQVLLHAKEMSREYDRFDDSKHSDASNTDCKKTTYLEIATDRSERKCMDNLPSNGNALFGSGSHNFTLTYLRNDPLSEMFFYFELKASPIKKDHHVQIICNWGRRTTTTKRTTLPTTRKRQSSTMSVLLGGQLSRINLIRHSTLSTDEIENLNGHDYADDQNINIDETTDEVIDANSEPVDSTIPITTTTEIITRKAKKKKKTTTTSIEHTTTSIITSNVDDEWLNAVSMAGIELPAAGSDNDLLNSEQDVTSSVQASMLTNDEKSRGKMSTSKIFILIIIIVLILILISTLFCLRTSQLDCIQHLKMNFNIAILFCCEAGKLMFTSSDKQQCITGTPTNTLPPTHTRSVPIPISEYQSSEYYVTGTGNMCHTTLSIYDDAGGGKSIYTIEDDEDDAYYDEDDNEDQFDESEYTTRYDRHTDGDTC